MKASRAYAHGVPFHSLSASLTDTLRNGEVNPLPRLDAQKDEIRRLARAEASSLGEYFHPCRTCDN